MTDPEFTAEELSTEEWRDVPSYEGIYKVSSLGRVQGTYNRILRPDLAKGYHRVTLYRNKVATRFTVHRLVALVWLGSPPPSKTETNHLDGNKLNNRPSNLEYCTRGENATHAAAHGLLSRGAAHAALIKAKTPRGERNHAAKLSESDVLTIRSLYNGKRGHAGQLARQFGVDKSLIGMIVRRKIWTHI